MSKRITGLALGALLLALSVPVEAQQPAKTPKIGVLQFRSESDPGPGRQVLRTELRALGYIEGKNIAFEYRSAEGQIDQLSAAAGALVRLNIDLLVAASTPGALAVTNATKTIPIVFYDVVDPVGSGLVDSLARPGGNVTGVTNIGAVLAASDWSYLKKPFPRSLALRYYGIHKIPARRNNGKKAN